MNKDPSQLMKGRGAAGNPDNRYDVLTREAIDDGWARHARDPEPLRTTLTADNARTVISYNNSPDVPFDRSINPYRGCEHGCIYCFARPTHAWLGLSPGLDFESRLLYKPDAAELLKKEVDKKTYRCQPIAVGINTDAYQPVERKLGITRSIIEVLAERRHPLSIVTKSALIERDIDILAAMAQDNLAQVAVSITTLDSSLARSFEPRASAPQRRLETVARLAAAGIPVTVLIAPVVPVLTDAELESLLHAAREFGACSAAYVLLRLPHELTELFQTWLEIHAPLKAGHVMNRLYDCHEGKAYDASFGDRMTGKGIFAELLKKRYRVAMQRLDFPGLPELDTSRFRPATASQLALF
jgi:DNA repair photolyase